MGIVARDCSGRRKRLTPASSGKRITPQQRDLLWFSKLAEHGPLPSSFLLAFARDTHKNDKRALERLTDLFNEDNTPDDGPYLTRPPQQFRTLDARYNQLVYDLAPAGDSALKQNGRALPCRSAPSGPWLHRFMSSCITASIELATLDRPDLTYIPQSRILARANTDLRCPVTIIDPGTRRPMTKDLIPDAVFGSNTTLIKGAGSASLRLKPTAPPNRRQAATGTAKASCATCCNMRPMSPAAYIATISI